MPQFNFFDFVRNGVRQAVLLGVSDAVEQIGAPVNGEDLQDQLSEAVQNRLTDQSTTRGGGKRKRLGRSLKEIEGSAT